jgi:hypothetical protein
MTYSPPFTLNDTILVLVAELHRRAVVSKHTTCLSRSPKLAQREPG